MRFGFRLMALVFMLPALAGRAETYKYYQQADIDPVTKSFTGRYAATEEQCRKAVCARFLYNEQGKLQKVDWVLDGNALFYDPRPGQTVVSGERSQRFITVPRTRLPFTTGSDDMPSLARAAGLTTFENNDIEQTLFQFDSRGQVDSISYIDHFGKPAEDERHCSKTFFFRDDQGRPVKVKTYNKHGGRVEPYETQLKYQQNEGKLEVTESRYSVEPAHEKPVEGRDGIFSARKTFDKNHNLIEERFYGLDRKPKASTETGAAVFKYQYNEAGDLTEVAFFGPDEKPVESSSEAAAAVKYKYDGNGLCVEKSFYGVDGKLKKGGEGAAVVAYEYDLKQLNAERRFLNPKGKPVANPARSNAAKVIQKFNDRGMIAEEWYYNAKGKPFAGFKAKYDSRGNLAEVTSYAGDNKISQPREKGASTIRFKYDDLDGVAEVTFYDAKGSLVNRKDMKIAGIWIARDRRGFPLDTRFFDKDRQIKKYRIEGFTPVAEIKMLFDSRGLTEQAKYLDQKGKPVLR